MQPPTERKSASTRTSRTLRIAGDRCRVRLHPVCWAALADAATEQGLEVERLMEMIAGHRGRTALHTAAERFVAAYFRPSERTAPAHAGLKEDPSVLEEALDHLH